MKDSIDLFEHHRGEVDRLTSKSEQSPNTDRAAVYAELAKAHAILATALVNDHTRRRQ